MKPVFRRINCHGAFVDVVVVGSDGGQLAVWRTSLAASDDAARWDGLCRLHMVPFNWTRTTTVCILCCKPYKRGVTLNRKATTKRNWPRTRNAFASSMRRAKTTNLLRLFVALVSHIVSVMEVRYVTSYTGCTVVSHNVRIYIALPSIFRHRESPSYFLFSCAITDFARAPTLRQCVTGHCSFSYERTNFDPMYNCNYESIFIAKYVTVDYVGKAADWECQI